jgi:uncharacterized protein YijF (DUF1287 family)
MAEPKHSRRSTERARRGSGPARSGGARRIGILLAALLALMAATASAASPDDLLAAARAQIGVTVRYDPAYVRLPYPGGDVPQDRGVCTDVVIRAYRALGVDLQRLVHEDMRAHFHAYPRQWGLSRPDRNIDHRRVPNLETFFARRGARLAASDDPADYRAGDLVTWRLPGNLTHIGIVADRPAHAASDPPLAPRPLIVHNVGSGARLEDVLFAWPITGHYRYLPEGTDR